MSRRVSTLLAALLLGAAAFLFTLGAPARSSADVCHNPGSNAPACRLPPSTSPAPSPSDTSPAPSPSPSPSATTPAPTTTTPAPSSSPPPSGALNCMPVPSACGWPDETNTGVPAGTVLTEVTGTVYLTTPGMVYSGYDVHGTVYVEADNITIQNTRVIGANYYPIRAGGVSGNPVGTIVRDTEIDFAGFDDAKGIAFDNYTAQRVWFHNGMDCAHAGVNVLVEDSFCELSVLAPGSTAHADGFQSDGGGNITIRHNTIRNPNPQTSAILMSTNTAPISGVTVVDNLMAGGGYTLYCGTGVGGLAADFHGTGNRFSRMFYTDSGYFGATTSCAGVAEWSGNVWDDDGTPVNP